MFLDVSGHAHAVALRGEHGRCFGVGMATILVPLDFSDCAPNVLDEAVRFAGAFGADLLLLHANETPRGIPLNALVQRGPGGAARPVSEVLREDAEAHLAPMVARAAKAGVKATSRLAFGRIADAILEAASGAGATMIVMGTHGRTGLARATLGSVAEDVMHHAEVPVVTVRTQHRPGCASRSCATCDLGRTSMEDLVSAEDVG
jgi:nucleotide-binding universal stress UspA family protein